MPHIATAGIDVKSLASDGRRAYPIARQLFDAVIGVLRRDSRIHASRDDLELLLADAHHDAEIVLKRELRGRIALTDLEEDR